MKEYLVQYGIEYGLVIGAIVGGIAAMKTSREKLLARLSSFFIGVPVAIYLSPLLCNMLGVIQKDSQTGVAVIVGYGGITLLDRLLTTTYKKLDDNGKL